MPTRNFTQQGVVNTPAMDEFSFSFNSDKSNVNGMLNIVDLSPTHGRGRPNIIPPSIQSVFRIIVPEGGVDISITWSEPSYFPDYIATDWNDNYGAYLRAKTPNSYNWGDGVINSNDWYMDGSLGIFHHYDAAGIYDINISGNEVFINNIQYLSFEIVGLSPTITHLSCFGDQLTALPDSIPPALTILDCGGNQLTALPDNLPSSLAYLFCYSNQLTILPDTLPATLTYLECYNNNLTSLPDNLSTKITYLSCSNNQLTSLPNTLPSELIYLYCNNNQLITLPDVLPNTLNQLVCYYNHITVLPDILPTSLTYLECSINQLSALEVDATLNNIIALNLENLRYVNLQMSPAVVPTPSVVSAFLIKYPNCSLSTDQ